MRYIQNQTTLEIHCLDNDGRALEVCNTDQIESREELEEADALRAVAAHNERACGHCWPKDVPADPKDERKE